MYGSFRLRNSSASGRCSLDDAVRCVELTEDNERFGKGYDLLRCTSYLEVKVMFHVEYAYYK